MTQTASGSGAGRGGLEVAGVLVDVGSQDGLPIADNAGGKVMACSSCHTSGAALVSRPPTPWAAHLRLAAWGRKFGV